MIAFRALRIAVVVAALAITFAAARRWLNIPTGRLETTIQLDSAHPGRLQVDAVLRGHNAKELVAAFYLPSQVATVENWRVSGALSRDANALEHHQKGVILRYSRWLLKPAGGGDIRLSYSITVSQRLRTPSIGAAGPYHGYSSATAVAVALDDILPRITLAGNAAKSAVSVVRTYQVQVKPGSYRLSPGSSQLEGGCAPDGYYEGAIIAGEYKAKEFHANGYRINLLTARPPSEELEAYTLSLLKTVVPLFNPKHITVTAAAIPGSADDVVVPVQGIASVALDLEPLTPERADRYASSLISALLQANSPERGISSEDEQWTLSALPEFYAARAAADAGFLDTDRLRWDVLYRYNDPRVAKFPLSSWTRHNGLTKQIMSEREGYVALTRLDDLLKARGSNLEEFWRSFWYGSRTADFKGSLQSALGGAAFSQYWSAYVAGSSGTLSQEWKFHFGLSPDHPLPDTAASAEVGLTGQIEGNLELCGCKISQSGGAPRRVTMLKTLLSRKAYLLDLGDFAPYPETDNDPIKLLESTMMTKLMGSAQYSAIALTNSEVGQLGGPVPIGGIGALTSANLDRSEFWRTIRIGQHTFAVVAWTDPPILEKYKNKVWLSALKNGVSYRPETLLNRLSRVPPEMDGIILIGYVHPLTIKAALERTPRIRAVFSTFEGEDSDRLVQGYIGDTFVWFWRGNKGGMIGSALLRTDGRVVNVPERTRTLLNERIVDDMETKQRLNDFYNSAPFLAAATTDVKNGFLGVDESLFAKSEQAGASYVGSAQCQGCHQEEYRQWSRTQHATAFRTLLGVHRNHHPYCVSCHVIGFNTASGYHMADQPSRLENVGCESCHGPGSRHLLTPSKTTILGKVARQQCESCHTDDHSSFAAAPDDYMKRISHRAASTISARRGK